MFNSVLTLAEVATIPAPVPALVPNLSPLQVIDPATGEIIDRPALSDNEVKKLAKLHKELKMKIAASEEKLTEIDAQIEAELLRRSKQKEIFGIYRVEIIDRIERRFNQTRFRAENKGIYESYKDPTRRHWVEVK